MARRLRREGNKHYVGILHRRRSGRGRYALPIDRTLISAKPTMLDEPHHDYPAIDLLVPDGSPVYAVRGQTIARTVEWPNNCWQLGRCDQTCGVGVSVNADDGAKYIYCHGSRLNGLDVGDTVTAGQLIMWSGNTGRSGAPQLHLEIRLDGEQRCPQQLLRDLFDTGRGIAIAICPCGMLIPELTTSFAAS